MSEELAVDLATLSLYDIVIYAGMSPDELLTPPPPPPPPPHTHTPLASHFSRADLLAES